MESLKAPQINTPQVEPGRLRNALPTSVVRMAAIGAVSFLSASSPALGAQENPDTAPVCPDAPQAVQSPGCPPAESLARQVTDSTNISNHRFVGYDQNARNRNGSYKWGSHMARSGCGVVSAAMVIRAETGNRNINPKSTARILRQSNQNLWGSSGPIKKDKGFKYLGRRFDIDVRRSGLKDAVRADKAGGHSILLFAHGYFAGTSGHYIAVKDVARKGRGSNRETRFILSDSNGKGKHGNSERRKGWSAAQLRNRGLVDVWTFRPQN